MVYVNLRKWQPDSCETLVLHQSYQDSMGEAGWGRSVDNCQARPESQAKSWDATVMNDGIQGLHLPGNANPRFGGST